MKKRLLPIPFIFAVLFAPLQSASDSAYACSCVMTTVEERVEMADVVAIGTVAEVYAAPFNLELKDEVAEVQDTDAYFDVVLYYKGSGPTPIAVDDPPSGGTCGFVSEADVGKEAVLYLIRNEGGYSTSLCAGSNFLPPDEASRADLIADIETATGSGGQPPESVIPTDVELDPASGGAPLQETEGEHEDTPWAVILPLAFGIPLAVLLVPAFLRRRGGRH